MRKDNIVRKSQGKRRKLTIGLDLGDRSSRYCILDEQGEVLSEGSVATTKKGLAQVFGSKPRSRMALEVGTHSPWVSRYLTDLGHEVIVANARRVRLITDSSRKNDRLDAKTLARLARIDPELLSPIRHRSEQAQADLMVIRARAALIEVRTMLVNCARGLTKSFGERLPSCGTGQVREELAGSLSEPLQNALKPLLAEVESVSQRIREYDEQIENIAKSRYPETELLKQVHGVGTLTALTYVLTVEDPQRFRRSRDAGAYFGLRPKQRESGNSRPQLRITKEGDAYVRKLLVQCAHHILGPFGRDSDLRRWGLKLAEHGGKNGKKRALVAVARKLAVVLHKLWVSGEVYEPLHVRKDGKAAAA
ncbi:MAG TPA: IS110 family transposase [Bryobacteraceae bacterium]|jgi:transposase|nr:IS110 family transposase [Bryobacteraceae bacterium]